MNSPRTSKRSCFRYWKWNAILRLFADRIALAGILGSSAPGFAGEFFTTGPLTPESEAARGEITFRKSAEPAPEPFPIESFGYGFARGNFIALAQRAQQNPDAFKMKPGAAPYPPPPEPPPNPSPQQTPSGIAKKSFRLLSHDSTSSTPPPSVATKFLALLDDNSNVVPPDTHGAVGPNHAMTSLNTEVIVQNRVGEQSGTNRMTLRAFWSALTNPSVAEVTDPRTLYDPYGNRWISVAVAEPFATNSAVLLAVSTNSVGDPTPSGNWWFYREDADITNHVLWADFPSVGFNKNWIVVSVNMFTTDAPPAYVQQQILVFNKANKYAGTNQTQIPPLRFFITQDTNAVDFTTIPAITHDNTLDTLYLLTERPGSPGKLRISTVNGPLGSESFTVGSFFSTTNNWAFSPQNRVDFAPQLNSTNKIQNGDSRMQSVAYRNGSIWFAHTVFFPYRADPNQSAIHWGQVNSPTNMVQQGLIQDSDVAYFYGFPSIAVNKSNDVLLAYSRFAASDYAGGNYAFRFASDANSSLRHDTVLKAGEAKYYKDLGSGKNRWGDYSATVVDPVNDTWMWTIQEYAATPTNSVDRWSTWWSQIMSAPNGDFNRDGYVDILWRYQAGFGDNGIWYMQGTNFSSSVASANEADLNWKIEGTIDTNLDGNTDFLWRNYSTGANRVWYMVNNGQTWSSTAPLTTVTDLNWTMTGTGDFNYDGQRDIVWHHRTTNTGDIAIWLMSGTAIADTATLPQHVTDLNWQIGGTGDFNKDNKTDILWFNTSTLQNAVWIMNGTNFVTTHWLPTNTEANWDMVAAGDYNGDGNTDIVWRNRVNGGNAIWLMDGTTNILSTVSLPIEPDTLWKIVGPK